MLGSSAENLALLEGFIRRDRNHPSVILYSIGNEIPDSTSATVGGEAWLA